MNRQLKLPLIISLCCAVILIFLFSKSQVDQQKHMDMTTTLLTLKEYDQTLQQSVIQNQSGQHKNFDYISRLQLQVVEVIQSLKSHFSTSDFNNSRINEKLAEISLMQEKKSKLIENYKQLTALNNLAKQNVPGAYKDSIIIIANDKNLDVTEKRYFKKKFTYINNVINRYMAGYAIADERLQREIAILEKEILSLQKINNRNQKKLIWFFNTVKTIYNNSTLLTDLVNNIQRIESVEKIEALQKSYLKHFENQSNKAFFYKKLLFLSSIILLVYVAFVLIRLRSTSTHLEESNEHLEFQKHALDEHAIVSITDTNGVILYANDKFCEISKYSREELVGKKHNIIKSNFHDKTFYEEIWKAITNGNIWQNDMCNQAKDNSLYWISTTLIPRLDGTGKPYEYIGIGTDITAQKNAEEEVTALARFPMENPDPVMRINRQGEVIYFNIASQPLMDYFEIQLHEKLPDEWLTKVLNVLDKNIATELELTISKTCYLLTLAPFSEENYINVYGRDITEKKQAEASLSYQATHDALTGLANRYAFEIELKTILSNAQKRNQSHILLYIDLDQFKVVNDTCGHIAGDELLQQLSQLLQSKIRENDTLARLGGDEFGVLLNNCDKEVGIKLANILLEVINQYRFIWSEKHFEVGASIGMVEINKESNSIVSIMGHADIACYAAKDAGRNQINVYDNSSESTQRQSELNWASLIPKALAEDRFSLMVQSITPLHNTDELEPHYEILLRMFDENEDFIPPGAFIPAAERYGLMQSIDRWVIAHVFEFLQEFISVNGMDDLPRLAINLSGESMGNESLLNFIHSEIESKAIPANKLCFEVTETAAIGNLNKALDFINNLREIGCLFALDDFGCGLSSFSYLKTLPVDYLKIDGSFVKDMVTDPIDASMVSAINQVGHIMKIHTIAEFVEDQAIVDALIGLGVDYAQGYHIDKPTPIYEKFDLSVTTNKQLYG